VIAKLDVAVQAPAHVHEPARGGDHSGRVYDEHAHARKRASEYEALQRLEEVVVVEDLRLEVVREDRQRAIREPRDLDDRRTYFRQARQDLSDTAGLGLLAGRYHEISLSRTDDQFT
jgi:hypothetical protein